MSSLPTLELITRLPELAARPADAHKGQFGRVLVVAGSRGMSGAAVLCAGAALRGGAGLVYLAVPEDVLPLVAPANPCNLTVPLPGDRGGRLGATALDPLLERVSASTVAVLGPGLGQSADLGKVVRAVLE